MTARVRERLVVVAAIPWLDSSTVLVQRRPAAATHGGGRLELPGGKVERGESPQEALMRELREECGEATRQWRLAGIAEVCHHMYPEPGPEVILLVFHVDASSVRHNLAALSLLPGADVSAQQVEDLNPEEFLAADADLIARLANRTLVPVHM